MRNAHGVGILTHPDYKIERDACVCNHCQRIFHVGPRQDPASIGGICSGCNEIVCPRCAALRARGEPCLPWEKQMELLEAAVEKQRIVAAWF